jgi:hypothetical protein
MELGTTQRRSHATATNRGAEVAGALASAACLCLSRWLLPGHVGRWYSLCLLYYVGRWYSLYLLYYVGRWYSLYLLYYVGRWYSLCLLY